MILGFIEDQQAKGRAVESVCKVLRSQGVQVAARTYRAWKHAAPSARAVADAVIIDRLRSTRGDPERLYGRRKMTAWLRRQGHQVSSRRVDRLMRVEGMNGLVRGRGVRTTIPDKHADRAPDLLERDFTAGAPNHRWVADFTYVRTWGGFVYVAFVIDCFSRSIVGWHAATTKQTSLVTTALRAGLWRRDRAGQVSRPGLCITVTRAVKVDSTGRRNTSIAEVGMGRPAGWMTTLTGRSPMRSPGAPSHRREVERLFWREIAKGLLPEEAADVVGASQAVGSRWFRHGGGMSPFDLKAFSGRYLTFQEREEIALLKAQGRGVREIARSVGRAPSTISRELRRNAATRGAKLDYRASVAQWKAELVARRPKVAKLVANPRLHTYVQERLSGHISRPDGSVIVGPATSAWTGRNKPHRNDRAWVQAWSPEQIANRIKVDFPDDESMRISHEAIYQALYIQGRGALKRELILCLRTGRALRAPRARSRRQTWAHVTPEALISQRPAEAEDRAVPGHWEGDLIIGLERSAIGTVVERSTRFTMLVHLPREEGHGTVPRTKNGPALGGYGAISMKNALATTMSTLPEQLARSLTWDRGKEMSAHTQFRVETGIPVFFADPHSPWQRGTNENTNGLLRQYFPKGTDLARWSAEELEAVAHALNTRPRKTLGWKTPAEAFNEQLLLLQQAGVASTR